MDGSIRIGSDNRTCDSGLEGALRYTGSTADQNNGAPVTNGLILYYQYGESSGTTVADSAGANNGVFAAPPAQPVWLGAGRIGRAIQFPPNTELTTPAAASLATTSFTRASWVRIESNDFDLAGLIVKEDRNYYLIGEAGELICGFYNGVSWYETFYDYSYGLDDQNWAHVACTFDNTTKVMRLYVNGVLGESRTHTGRTPVATTAPIFFGTDGDTYAYHGSLDDTRIYNRALTGAEVAALAGWNGSGENGKIDVCTPAGWTPWGE